jgi:hypothetical protein
LAVARVDDSFVLDPEEALAAVERAVDQLIASGGIGLGPLLERVTRVRDKVDYCRSRAINDYDRSGIWQAEGFRTAASGVRAHCRVSPGVASYDVSLAAKVRELPEVEAAWADGEISRGHASMIATAATPGRVEALRELSGSLLEVARVSHPKELRPWVDYINGAIDGDDGAERARAQHERRGLYVAETLDGMWRVDGSGEPVQGKELDACLRAEMKRAHRAGDTRSRPQQRWDALFTLVKAGSEHRGTNRRGGLTYQLDISEIDRRTGSTDLGDQIRAEAKQPTGLSRATLEQLACDAGIRRVITDGPSQVLDVGFATRTVSPSTWTALVARDGGCTRCRRPPEDCEAHHIVPWPEGPTTLDNLKLLCVYECHWDEHVEQYGPRSNWGKDPP